MEQAFSILAIGISVSLFVGVLTGAITIHINFDNTKRSAPN